jgi:hypothetical protein
MSCRKVVEEEGILSELYADEFCDVTSDVSRTSMCKWSGFLHVDFTADSQDKYKHR